MVLVMYVDVPIRYIAPPLESSQPGFYDATLDELQGVGHDHARCASLLTADQKYMQIVAVTTGYSCHGAHRRNLKSRDGMERPGAFKNTPSTTQALYQAFPAPPFLHLAIPRGRF